MTKHLNARSCVVAAIIGATFMTAPSAQQIAWAKDSSTMERSDNWPLYRPGDLPFDTSRLKNIRVAYDMDFGGNGLTGGHIDVDRVVFKGKSALWVQWKFSQDAEGDSQAWPSLDLLILDEKTGALLARTAPSNRPRGDWGGPYSSIEVRNGEFRRLTLSPSGEGKLTVEPLDSQIFDFGALGFVLPFLEFDEPENIRLQTYLKSLGDAVQAFPLEFLGEQEISDSRGERHRATAIKGLSPDGSAEITFYTIKSAPYFYGWDYRKTEDNSMLFQMRYRGHVITEVPPK